MFKSNLKKLNRVTAFPRFTGERHYMVPFTKRGGLPPKLQHWAPLVSQMLLNVDVNDSTEMFVMIDQREVPAGQSHRRGGVHIDGYWSPSLHCHGGGGGGRHKGSLPSPEEFPERSVPSREQRVLAPKVPKTPPAPANELDLWLQGDGFLAAPEALLLASDVTGARAHLGEWEGVVGRGGDCSAVDLRHLQAVDLNGGFVYAGNVACLHESLALSVLTCRSLVRINVPGWAGV